MVVTICFIMKSTQIDFCNIVIENAFLAYICENNDLRDIDDSFIKHFLNFLIFFLRLTIYFVFRRACFRYSSSNSKQFLILFANLRKPVKWHFKSLLNFYKFFKQSIFKETSKRSSSSFDFTTTDLNYL